MKLLAKALFIVVFAWMTLSSRAGDVFDSQTGVLSIPQVVVGAKTYTDVQITVSKVMELGYPPSFGNVDTYDVSTNRLQIPSVMVSGFEYFNVSVLVGEVLRVGSYKINPIAVQSSSFINRKNAVAQVGAQNFFYDATAYADFFQEGSYSVVTHSLLYDRNNPLSSNQFGKINFYRQNKAGIWEDQTNSLLMENTGCLHPRKAIVADFNADKKPDVFIACHGFDAPPFAGEQQVLLLSQKDGRYSTIKLPGNCFCHGASAVDMDADGYANILVVDPMVEKTPYFLVNDKKGGFIMDKTRLPSSLYNKALYSTELLDVNGDGQYDVFVAGADPDGNASNMSPTFFLNDGRNRFVSTKPIPIGLSLSSNSKGLVSLDLTYHLKSYYLLRTDYQVVSISKIEDLSMPAQEIYNHVGNYSKANSPWFAWFEIYNNMLVSLNAYFPFSLNVAK